MRTTAQIFGVAVLLVILGFGYAEVDDDNDEDDDDDTPDPAPRVVGRAKEHHLRRPEPQKSKRQKKLPASLEESPHPQQKKRIVRTTRRAPRESDYANFGIDTSSLHERGASTTQKKKGLLERVKSLDKEITHLTSAAAGLSKSVGGKYDERPSSVLASHEGHHIKDRVNTVEAGLSEAHTAISSLEHELLGRSEASLGTGPRPLKEKIVFLEQAVDKMKGRMAVLDKEKTSVGRKLDQLESSLGSLSSKAATMLKDIESSASDEQLQERSNDATFMDRFHALAAKSDKLQLNVESLEEELRGEKGQSSPANKKAKTLGEKLNLLEARRKNMVNRLKALEDEV